MVDLGMLKGWDKADNHYQEVLVVVEIHKKGAQLGVDNFDRLEAELDNQVQVAVGHRHHLVVHRKHQVEFLEAVDNNLLYYFVVVAEHIQFEHMSLKSGE